MNDERRPPWREQAGSVHRSSLIAHRSSFASDVIYRTDLAYIHHHGFSEFAESAAPGVLELLRREGIAGGRVVDAGCGTGILARELTHAGFDVHGFDASPAMIALARETAPRAHFAVASVDSYDLPACDVIVAMGEVLNYAPLEVVHAFITRAARALRPGGMLVFDIGELDSYPDSEEHRFGGEDWSVILTRERHGDTVHRRMLTFRKSGEDILRDDEVHALTLHERSAMLTLLRSNGFRVRVRRSYGSLRLPAAHAVYVCVRL
jgi:SAM-dependent methyltransferase